VDLSPNLHNIYQTQTQHVDKSPRTSEPALVCTDRYTPTTTCYNNNANKYNNNNYDNKNDNTKQGYRLNKWMLTETLQLEQGRLVTLTLKVATEILHATVIPNNI